MCAAAAFFKMRQSDVRAPKPAAVGESDGAQQGQQEGEPVGGEDTVNMRLSIVRADVQSLYSYALLMGITDHKKMLPTKNIFLKEPRVNPNAFALYKTTCS